jgi:hypothetical protein
MIMGGEIDIEEKTCYKFLKFHCFSTSIYHVKPVFRCNGSLFAVCNLFLCVDLSGLGELSQQTTTQNASFVCAGIDVSTTTISVSLLG